MKNNILLKGADTPLFYSMKEACEILNLSRKTLSVLVEKGAIKAVNVGLANSKVYRFTPDSIFDFINGYNANTVKKELPKAVTDNIKSKLNKQIHQRSNPFAKVQ